MIQIMIFDGRLGHDNINQINFVQFKQLCNESQNSWMDLSLLTLDWLFYSPKVS